MNRLVKILQTSLVAVCLTLFITTTLSYAEESEETQEPAMMRKKMKESTESESAPE